ncbi:amino acid ABC transporter substrate-binding protein [Edwardsiella ictaluri]|uniref:ABC transporter, perplasmic amino acid binding protein, putative n=2 Tax=Edwardsiella ictaluri TaxID=67780 RepID=C5B978_EDWI9|nr:transporter substrate-binding domain-containing protein [Edwardsiella ictaluri]ACR70818.1 ABC transporter, perplasmic amino acid binding protein, putative [Edwardsiella ictaluri 93-146]AVZ82395.1 amino acid ABC transporter substrate-binding protein [Edwardsiella ictaluri]EKS7762921.1 transporter substrate-binding domain-containing protein [Edwardsiella ictaluri]EKS7769833.1 transporter substrate-binding domain-containing protein [Edwardsiella ictaluri]EKS7772886.1 transporter substrate-bind
MKKIHFWLTILLSLSGIHSATAKGWQDIKQSGELRVGVPGDYAPLAFHDKQGHLVGFDIDMAHSLGQALHLNIRFVLSSWPTLSADLAADKFDIAMGGVTETPDRREKFALSSPVLKNGKIALTQCNRVNDFKSLEDIDHTEVRVVVNPGGTNQDYVDIHIRHAKVIRERDNTASLQRIRERSADIMFTDLLEGNYYQNNEPGIFCVSIMNILPGTVSNKVYMMAKDNKYLLKTIDKWLSDGNKSRLSRKWQISTE